MKQMTTQLVSRVTIKWLKGQFAGNIDDAIRLELRLLGILDEDQEKELRIAVAKIVDKLG